MNEFNEYETEMLENLANATNALKYYMRKCHQLEKELENHRGMYANRIEEYLKLEERVKILEEQLDIELKRAWQGKVIKTNVDSCPN